MTATAMTPLSSARRPPGGVESARGIKSKLGRRGAPESRAEAELGMQLRIEMGIHPEQLDLGLAFLGRRLPEYRVPLAIDGLQAFEGRFPEDPQPRFGGDEQFGEEVRSADFLDFGAVARTASLEAGPKPSIARPILARGRAPGRGPVRGRSGGVRRGTARRQTSEATPRRAPGSADRTARRGHRRSGDRGDEARRPDRADRSPPRTATGRGPPA